MRIAYYPGCAAKSMFRSAYERGLEALSALGEVFEVPDWVCCTGGVAEEKEEGLLERITAVNLLLAASKGADVVATSCSMCLSALRRGAARLTRSLLEDVAEKLGVGVPESLPRILHVADLLVERASRVELRVSGRAALYPGCMYISSSGGLPAAKRLVSRLSRLAGVEFRLLTGCCGFPIYASRPRESAVMASKVEQRAESLGVDVVVTLCPLCKVSLRRFTGLEVYLLEEVLERVEA